MMKVKRLAAFALVSVGLVAALAASPVAAMHQPATQFAACNSPSNLFGFPAWDSCLPHEGKNPVIKSLDDIWKIVFPIVESIIRAAAYIAVIMIVWGGINYIKSQGDAKKTASAKNTILNAVIGLVICIVSVTIVRFIADRFSG